MASILEYLEWRGDLPFAADAFGLVDNLICTQLAYLPWNEVLAKTECCSLRTAAKRLMEQSPDGVIPCGLMKPKPMQQLLEKVAESVRFGEMVIWKPVQAEHTEQSEQPEQFFAVSFLPLPTTCYVAFRGTDQSISGWKEDFNMGFLSPVPSQRAAAAYLTEVAAAFDGTLLTGGHSKGGNLAVYAAAFAQGLGARLETVYNNDGPGFPPEIVETPEYLAILPRIVSIVPEGSVVGMLLEHRESYSIVKSTQHGILQHDAFTWEVLGNRFVSMPARSLNSRLIDRTLTQWLRALPIAEREEFVNALYAILAACGSKTFSELSIDRMMRGYRDMKPEAKESLLRALRLLRNQAIATASEFAKGLRKPKLIAEPPHLPETNKESS